MFVWIKRFGEKLYFTNKRRDREKVREREREKESFVLYNENIKGTNYNLKNRSLNAQSII